MSLKIVQRSLKICFGNSVEQIRVFQDCLMIPQAKLKKETMSKILQYILRGVVAEKLREGEHFTTD